MSPTRQEIEAADRHLLAALQKLTDARGLLCEPHARHVAHRSAQAWNSMQARIPVADRTFVTSAQQPASLGGNDGALA